MGHDREERNTKFLHSANRLCPRGRGDTIITPARAQTQKGFQNLDQTQWKPKTIGLSTMHGFEKQGQYIDYYDQHA